MARPTIKLPDGSEVCATAVQYWRPNGTTIEWRVVNAHHPDHPIVDQGQLEVMPLESWSQIEDRLRAEVNGREHSSVDTWIKYDIDGLWSMWHDADREMAALFGKRDDDSHEKFGEARERSFEARRQLEEIGAWR